MVGNGVWDGILWGRRSSKELGGLFCSAGIFTGRKIMSTNFSGVKKHPAGDEDKTVHFYCSINQPSGPRPGDHPG